MNKFYTIVLVLFMQLAHAQNVSMLYNSNTNKSTDTQLSYSEIGQRVYYISKSNYRYVPWVYDKETKLHARIDAEETYYFIGYENNLKFVECNGKVYFIFPTPDFGMKIFQYDPITTKTKLIKKIDNTSYTPLFDLMVIGDEIYFLNYTETYTYDLLKYNTIEETISSIAINNVKLSSLVSYVYKIVEFEGKFWLWSSPTSGAFDDLQLLSIDAITGSYNKIPLSKNLNASAIKICNGHLYFTDNNNQRLYKVNTENNTISIKNSNSFSEYNSLSCFENDFYYINDLNKLQKYDIELNKVFTTLDTVIDKKSFSKIQTSDNSMLLQYTDKTSKNISFEILKIDENSKYQVQPLDTINKLFLKIPTSANSFFLDTKGEYLYFIKNDVTDDSKLVVHELNSGKIADISQIKTHDQDGIRANGYFEPTKYEGRVYYQSDTGGIASFDLNRPFEKPIQLHDQINGYEPIRGYTDLVVYHGRLWFSAKNKGKYETLCSWEKGKDSLITVSFDFSNINSISSYYIENLIVVNDTLYCTVGTNSFGEIQETKIWRIDDQLNKAIPISRKSDLVSLYSSDNHIFVFGTNSVYKNVLYQIVKDSLVSIEIPSNLDLNDNDVFIIGNEYIFPYFDRTTFEFNLAIYDVSQNKFTNIALPEDYNSSQSIMEKVDGKLWLGIGYKILEYNPVSKSFDQKYDLKSKGIRFAGNFTTFNGAKCYSFFDDRFKLPYLLDTVTNEFTLIGSHAIWQGTNVGRYYTIDNHIFLEHSHSTYGSEIWMITDCELEYTTTVQNTVTPYEPMGTISIDVIKGIQPITYEWSDGSRTSFLDSLIQGYYEVTISDATGCTKKENFYINTFLSNIENENGNAIKLYPNPTYDKLYIEIESNELISYDIELFDMTGRAISKQRFEFISNSIIDTEFLEPGIYNITIKDNKSKKIYCNRIVKI